MRPPTPSLIDFTVHKPVPTLLDEQDQYGFPPPSPVAEPYRDDFSDEGRSECNESYERDEGFGKLLHIEPRGRPREVRRLNGEEQKGVVKQEKKEVKLAEGGQGVITITLPDGTVISFKPPTGGNESAVDKRDPGVVSLAQPVVATGFEQAFETIKRLALGGAAPPKSIDEPVKKKTLESPNKRYLHPSRPILSRPKKSPWPIFTPTSQPSKLVPTAPAFKPSIRLAPPSPSTSPSPPFSSSTNPLTSSQSTSPDRYTTLLDSELTYVGTEGEANKAVLLSSPGEIAGLFKTDIKPIPWVEVDFPYLEQQKNRKKGKKGAKGKAGAEVYVPQTAEQLASRFDSALETFGAGGGKKATSGRQALSAADLNKQLESVLAKYNDPPIQAPFVSRNLKSSISNWSPPTPRPTSQSISADLLSLQSSQEVVYDPKSFRCTPDATALELSDDLYPSHPLALGESELYTLAGEMNGTPTYDWRGPRDPSAGLTGSMGSLTLHGQAHSTTYKPKSPLTPTSTSPYDRLMSHPSARQAVPSHIRHASDTLQSSMMTSWITAEPTEEQKKYVQYLTTRLTKLIDQEWGRGAGERDQRFTVDVFGSVSWGGETGKGGDIDLVVRDSQLPQGFHPSLWLPGSDHQNNLRPGQRQNIVRSDLHPLYDLKNLVILLRRRGYAEVTGIYQASTPIVKFKDPQRPGIEADVNVNDLGGWYNSRLILAYCEISPHVLRPLIHALKLWAQANHVNDASGRNGAATMSSYCLTLMAIGYLQHRGVLPNLQADVEVRIPDHPDTDGRDVIWACFGKKTGTKINVGFSETPPTGFRSTPMTAAQALRDFFAYFARKNSGTGFDYTTQIVSILNGGVINREKPQGQETQEAQRRKAAGIPAPTKDEMTARESMMGKGNIGVQPRNWGERRLVVQDPFIWQKNCTQSMSRDGLDRWLIAVDRAHSTLSTYGETCSLDTLLANCLAPPPGLLTNTNNDRNFSPLRGPFGRRGSPRGRGRGSPFGRTLYAA